MLTGSSRGQSPDLWGCGSQLAITQSSGSNGKPRKCVEKWVLLVHDWQESQAFRKREEVTASKGTWDKGDACPPTAVAGKRHSEPIILAASSFYYNTDEHWTEVLNGNIFHCLFRMDIPDVWLSFYFL